MAGIQIINKYGGIKTVGTTSNSINTIYNSDDSLSGNRILDGNGYDLSFTNLNELSFSLSGELNINSDPGSVDQILTSTGSGSSPIWKTFSETDPIFTSWLSGPPSLSEFTDDLGIITSSSSDTFTNKSGLISQWTNDSGYLLSSTATSTYQPLDSDLTAIAALSTDSFGRDLLTKTTGASIRTYIGAGTGDALTTNPLSQFASTTSSQLAGVISDETGSGSLVFGTSPTFTTQITSPKIIGGTGTTSTLTLQTTSGVGTTNADMIFLVGNNGGTEALRITNAGAISTSFNVSCNNLLASTLVRAGSTSSFSFNSRSKISSSADGMMEFTNNSGTANSATLVFGGMRPGYAAKTTTYTLTSTDYFIDCTSGTFTVTLPTAVGITGHEYIIKNSGVGTITIATTSSQTIDGVTTKTLSSQYSGYRLNSDGSNWKITASF